MSLKTPRHRFPSSWVWLISACALVAFISACGGGAASLSAWTPTPTTSPSPLAYTVLHAFNGADGSHPRAGLMRDSAGNLYGTTAQGGEGTNNYYGTVFKIDSSGSLRVLHSFNGADGKHPHSVLIMDSAGNLYGTTYLGGANGLGVVFKIDHSGSYSVLHSFGSDGRAAFGDLIVDSAGNVYGATNDGGANDEGSVFKITSSGSHSVLHSFSKDSDGRYPYVGLIMDSAGNLYGTASGGGTNAMGTVFRLGAN